MIYPIGRSALERISLPSLVMGENIVGYSDVGLPRFFLFLDFCDVRIIF